MSPLQLQPIPCTLVPPETPQDALSVPSCSPERHRSPLALMSHPKPLVPSGIQLVINVVDYKWSAEVNL